MSGRLTLAAQVALVVTLAILLAQATNLAIAIDNRRDQLLEEAVIPGAERLALVASEPRFIERLERADRFIDRPIPRRFAEQQGRGGRDGPRGRRGRTRLTDEDPIPADARPLPLADAVLAAAFADANVDIRVTRAALSESAMDRATRRERPRVILAAQLDDGRWLSVRGPGPEPLRPLIGALLLQSLLITLLILVPTLLLLRRVGGSLTDLARSADRFTGHRAKGTIASIEPKGPRDVAALIGSINAMQHRIVGMLEEKDVMLGAIGHDLRTPLTALRLEAEAVDDEERREALVDQIERLHAQLESILELARSDRALDPEGIVAPVAMIRSMLDSYHRDGREVALITDKERTFAGNEATVRRAVRNLIDNGLRHGTNVEIEVDSNEAAQVAIVVRDNGPGIPAAERERLKQPFERAETSRNRDTGGHGLGLAIVDAIMRRHGGKLEMDDRADARPGLEARMIFPLQSPD